MADGAFPVQWIRQQAIVTLPEHIDYSNADQVREQLLWIINRGAAVLIADLTGTVSCDYSGADSLARVQHRAIANGTELRLVATSKVVRRVLSLNGFDRLGTVYPDLDGAIAAGAQSGDGPGEEQTKIEDRAARAEELLTRTVDSISDVCLIMQAAIDLPPDAAAQRITEALRRLEDAARVIRYHLLTGPEPEPEPEPGSGPDAAGLTSPDPLERSAQARHRSILLQRHMAQTARAVQATAADTAALLGRRADFLGWHARVDYPTEVKRWQVLADQAGHIAERWEQQP